MAQRFWRSLIPLFLLLCAQAFAAPTERPISAPNWAQLKPIQQTLLKPLSADWPNMPQEQRLQWIGIADRFPRMTPQEQANVKQRMADWARLTPEARAKAREQYKKLRTVPPEARKQLEQKWRQYEALPPEQKQAYQSAPKALPNPAVKANPVPVGIQTRVRPPQSTSVAPVVKRLRKPLTPLPAALINPPVVTESPASAPAPEYVDAPAPDAE
jgi:Protein of unknown function (DUF3106)